MMVRGQGSVVSGQGDGCAGGAEQQIPFGNDNKKGKSKNKNKGSGGADD